MSKIIKRNPSATEFKSMLDAFGLTHVEAASYAKVKPQTIHRYCYGGGNYDESGVPAITVSRILSGVGQHYQTLTTKARKKSAKLEAKQLTVVPKLKQPTKIIKASKIQEAEQVISEMAKKARAVSKPAVTGKQSNKSSVKSDTVIVSIKKPKTNK